MRQAKPFFRQQTKTWYVQIGKRQHNLGSDQKQALEKYHGLMAGRQAVTLDTPVANLMLSFLEWAKKHKRASTLDFYKRHIASFCKHLTGGLTIRELKPNHVTRWIDETYKVGSDSYRRGAIRSIQRALNWAAEEGLIDASPVAKMKKPPQTPRDVLITPEQWGQLVAALALRGDNGRLFLELLTFMRHTGCRPLEARTAEARHLDRSAKCIIFERHESKGHGSGRAVDRRVVPLTDEAFALCERLAAKYPAGPLFRNSSGTAWNRHTMKEWSQRLDQRRYKQPSSKRVNFRLMAYAIRHTWATEALERGVDPVTVATIMGHKDLTMLMKVYQHLQRKGAHLRTALQLALGATATQPAASPA